MISFLRKYIFLTVASLGILISTIVHAAQVESFCVGEACDSVSAQTNAGDGSTSNFNINFNFDNNNQVLVYINGVLQTIGTDYTIVSGQVVFTTPPANGDTVTITNNALSNYVDTSVVSTDESDSNFGGGGTNSPQATVSIDSSSVPTQVVSGSTFTLGASGGSGTGAFGFTMQNGDCTVGALDGVVTVASSPGSCTVRLTRAGDDDYASKYVDYSFSFAANQDITANPLSIGNPGNVYANGTLFLTPSGGEGTGNYSVSVTAGSCTLNTNSVPYLNIFSLFAGSLAETCTITMNRESDSDYLATNSTTFDVTVRPAAVASLSDPANEDLDATDIATLPISTAGLETTITSNSCGSSGTSSCLDAFNAQAENASTIANCPTVTSDSSDSEINNYVNCVMQDVEEGLAESALGALPTTNPTQPVTGGCDDTPELTFSMPGYCGYGGHTGHCSIASGLPSDWTYNASSYSITAPANTTVSGTVNIVVNMGPHFTYLSGWTKTRTITIDYTQASANPWLARTVDIVDRVAPNSMLSNAVQDCIDQGGRMACEDDFGGSGEPSKPSWGFWGSGDNQPGCSGGTWNYWPNGSWVNCGVAADDDNNWWLSRNGSNVNRYFYINPTNEPSFGKADCSASYSAGAGTRTMTYYCVGVPSCDD